MKEITIRLADEVANAIAKEASLKGMSSEELCKYILGTFFQQNLGDTKQRMKTMLTDMDEAFDEIGKHIIEKFAGARLQILKAQAKEGALSCKNCTIKLSEQDVDNGKCGACGAPIDAAAGEDQNKTE